MNTLVQDVRYALRQLYKSPGFAITAILTLAIGIGANAGIFSIMDAVVLRPLAVPDLDRVVTVSERQKTHDDDDYVALANFTDWQRESRSFEEMAVREDADMSLTGAGDAAHVAANRISPSFFAVMRTSAALGRVFGDEETQPGRGNVAVLGYGFWKSHFDSDASVVGRTVELDQHPYTIVGVLPKTMQYPSTADMFVPFTPTYAQLANRTSHDYSVIGRLKPGVTVAQAQSELNMIAERLAKQYPATNQGWSVRTETLLKGINGDLTPLYMDLIQGATLFLLLVVCANVANLQFARGIARRPEIAMRTALGATRARLTRQLLTESMLLGLIGAGCGLAYAQVYLHLTLISMPEKVARYMSGWSNISLNSHSLALSLALALGAGVIAGLSPALDALRVNLVEQLKSGSRSVAGAGRSRWLRNTFAVAQISLAVALVAGASLMAKGMVALLHSTDRYAPEKMLTFSVHLPVKRYAAIQQQSAWYDQSLDRLRALPGVRSAEITSTLPETDDGWLDTTEIENRPADRGVMQSALRIPVSSGYFAAFGIPLMEGRGFESGDKAGAQPVAIVSRGYVASYFPNENPIGKMIRMGTGSDQTPWLRVVGVTGDTDYFMFRKGRPATVYMSVSQVPLIDETYTITTDGDPMALAPAARKALAAIDPALPLDSVETYKQVMHEKLVGMVFVSVLLGVNALVALALAAIGIFGVMANLVGERTREIGVRLAMGARREDVLRMILRRAMILTGTGLAIGLVLAFALAQGVANLFYGVRPTDPVVFGSISAAIAAIALLSSWIPARRAAGIDPIIALRDQ